jgi:hypothetical protein
MRSITNPIGFSNTSTDLLIKCALFRTVPTTFFCDPMIKLIDSSPYDLEQDAIIGPIEIVLLHGVNEARC